MGLRQILPVQTNRTFFKTAWGAKENNQHEQPAGFVKRRVSKIIPLLKTPFRHDCDEIDENHPTFTVAGRAPKRSNPNQFCVN
jgi:hypothetical protein